MIDDKMLTLMNEQIKNELESCYLYLSMVAYFHSLNLDGMAHWMRCQAHEEMIHAMKFFDHIIDRGGKVNLLDLQQIKKSWDSPLEAWRDAHNHEKKVTGNIHDLIKTAREEFDYDAEPLLGWFATEQIEEESNTDKVASQLEMIGSDKNGLLLLDRELAGRTFTAGSPLDQAAYKQAE